MYLEIYSETELARMTEQELAQIEAFAEDQNANSMREIDMHTNSALRLLDQYDTDGDAGHVSGIRDALQHIRVCLKHYDSGCAEICDVRQERKQRAVLTA